MPFMSWSHGAVSRLQTAQKKVRELTTEIPEVKLQEKESCLKSTNV